MSSLGCYNKVPRTGRLKTTDLYFPTVMECRSPESSSWLGQVPLPSFRWPLTIPGTPWLAVVSLQSLLQSSHGILPASLLLLSGHQPYWIKGSLYPSMASTKFISAKILFPNKVTFTGSRGQDFNVSFGERNSTHNTIRKAQSTITKQKCQRKESQKGMPKPLQLGTICNILSICRGI